jgi:glycosyltransferase involved in cell wall biosynthesis
MRVALVHDWLTGMRGGERVFEVLCELFPDAEVFTLVHVPGSVSPTIERLPRRTSFVQRLPLARRFYRQYLPLFPTAIELFDLDGFDLVLSSSHCVAKSVVTAGRTRHLCYCHTPMRYAWDQFPHYFGPQRIGRLPSAAAGTIMRRLARWDAATAHRPNRYLANSQHVARRIRRYYNRPADVVYPPVDTRFFHPGDEPRSGYVLVVSALVPYKRIENAIDASRLADIPLKIVGDGPDRSRLAALAGPTVEFLGRRSEEELRRLYRGADAVVLPGEEDFGIAPLEGQACGRPVVALARGGALETVIPGETGVLVEHDGPGPLAEGLRDAVSRRFDEGRIRRHAEQFSRERFADRIRACVDDTLAAPEGTRW